MSGRCLVAAAAGLLLVLSLQALAGAPESVVGIAREPPFGPLPAAKAAFLAGAGSDYGYKGWLDQHYEQELGGRLGKDQHYIDYTGAALYTNSHVRQALQLLDENAFGNPHSKSPSSVRSSRRVEAARSAVLQWFGADPEEYEVVWTKGATQALKMVGEWFPWSPSPGWHPPKQVSPGSTSDTKVGTASPCGAVPADVDRHEGTSTFMYFRANHKSVLGIGAYAKERGAQLACVDEQGIEAWLAAAAPAPPPVHAAAADQQQLAVASSWRLAARKAGPGGQAAPAPTAAPAAAAGAGEDPGSPGGKGGVTYSLVGYPAKDNYEGRLYPLSWVKQVQAKSTARQRWLVVLDAAAYVPTHHLNLTETPADFVCISFYKMFGFPTGLGALLVRKDVAALLHKTYFGGGSVLGATAEDVWRVLQPAPEGWEDGTIDFLGVLQLEAGLQQLQQLGGMEAIAAHVQSLRHWTYRALSSLRHPNQQPLIHLYGRHDLGPHVQSCLFEFQVLQPDGSALAPAEVEAAAGAAGLHLRAGCHCNPGQCYHDIGLQPEEFRAATLAGHALDPFIVVERPASEPLPPGAAVVRPAAQETPATTGTPAAATPVAGSTTRPAGKGRTVRVQIPNGSVRASLGYLSRFEDVYALVEWLYATYVPESAAFDSRSTAQQA